MINRRKFLATSSIAAGIGLSGLPLPTLAVPNGKQQLPLIRPKKLSKGDTIGLITPASGITRTSFEEALENIDQLGFKAMYSDHIRVRKGFLAGTDQQRLDDLHRMFEDLDIHGIVCARGGYGSARLLPSINYETIRANPKVLIGYSDITALLYGIFQHAGLVCFHGPVGASHFSPFTTEKFKKVIIKGKDKVTIQRPKEWETIEDPLYRPFPIVPGTARGTLIGGNLSLMVSLVGTPYDIDFTGKIIFIEEIEESPYRIDRMLTQLLLAGKLQQASGIAMGIFRDCDLEPDHPRYDHSLSLRDVLTGLLNKLDIPVVYGLPIGHIDDNATLPFGIEAELDTENRCLTLLESGVS